METPLPGGERLGLRLEGERLCEMEWLLPAYPLRRAANPAAERAVEAISHWFAHPALPAELPPLALGGTPFQRRVWQALTTIPPGRPITYGALARRLGSGAQAVAAACRANPVPILIPCHRVVSAGGVGGYMGAREGWPVAIKIWLLAHEREG